MGGGGHRHCAVLHLPYPIAWPEVLSPAYFWDLMLIPSAVSRPDICVGKVTQDGQSVVLFRRQGYEGTERG